MNYKNPNSFFKALLILVLIFQLGEAKSQDLQFSQFCNTEPSINPSLTGAINDKIRVLTNYRDQWSSISLPYKSFALSVDMALFNENSKKGFLGVGVSFLNDRAGSTLLELNQANLSIAYHTRISFHNYFSAGIVGGFAQRKINSTQMEWNSQYDGDNYNSTLPSYETSHLENKIFPDFGVGIEWSYAKQVIPSLTKSQLKINAGISVFHVNQPNISFHSSYKDNLPLKFVFHGKSQVFFNKNIYSFNPSFLLVKQGAFRNIIFGSSIRRILFEKSKYTGSYKGMAISLGCMYRLDDAIIPYCQIEFAKFSFGFSYDINISQLSNASSGQGGFEISLRWLNSNPFTKKKTQTIY